MTGTFKREIEDSETKIRPTENDVIAGFDEFCRSFSDIEQQLTLMNNRKGKQEKEFMLLRQKNAALERECQMMRDSLKESISKLDNMFEFEDEIRHLRDEVASQKQSANEQEQKRNEEILSLKDKQTEEIHEIEQSLSEKHNIKVQELESQIAQSALQIRYLNEKISTANQERQMSEDRITLEYETKLRSANLQKVDYQHHQRQILNQDVMRKKLQHLERENQILRQNNHALQVNQKQSCQEIEQQLPDTTDETLESMEEGYGAPVRATRGINPRGGALFLRKH